MTVKKNDVVLQFRVDADFASELHKLSAERAIIFGRRYTLSEAIRTCVAYGYPVAKKENQDPNVVDVLQKSHTQSAREIAITALKNAIKLLENGTN